VDTTIDGRENSSMRKSNAVWKKGPPPSIGWWPVLVSEDIGLIAWWNGHEWSQSCSPKMDPGLAEAVANKPAHRIVQKAIRWSERPASWPMWSHT
jgi:hypothetical protein